MSDGNILMRFVEGWPLGTLPASEEPRVRDLDLAERLGYERPRKIRELIARLEEQGKIGAILRRPTVGLRGFAEEIIEEAWLTEEQALLVTTQSETPKAWEVTREVLRVFRLAVRGLLPDQAPLTRAVALKFLVDDALAAGHSGAAVAFLNAARALDKGAPGQLPLVDVGPASERQVQSEADRLQAACQRVLAALACQRVLAALARKPAQSTRELLRRVGGNHTSTRAATRELVRTGAIVSGRLGAGTYTIASAPARSAP